MASLRGVIGRLRGDRVTELAAEVAALRELLLSINHAVHVIGEAVRATNDNVVAGAESVAALDGRLGELRDSFGALNHYAVAIERQVAELADLNADQRAVLLGLNHDVRAGAEDALPLFLGYAERLRLDTDTAIGAAKVIERQLALLEGLVAGAGEPERS